MSDYIITRDDGSQQLLHYRTVGSKNGVRRYQNEDGSLTAAGRARYLSGDGTSTNRLSSLSSTTNEIIGMKQEAEAAAAKRASLSAAHTPKTTAEAKRERLQSAHGMTSRNNAAAIKANAANAQNSSYYREKVNGTEVQGPVQVTKSKVSSDGSVKSTIKTAKNANSYSYGTNSKGTTSKELEEETAYNSKKNVYPSSNGSYSSSVSTNEAISTKHATETAAAKRASLSSAHTPKSTTSKELEEETAYNSKKNVYPSSGSSSTKKESKTKKVATAAKNKVSEVASKVKTKASNFLNKVFKKK